MSKPKLFTLGNTDIDLTTTNTSIEGLTEIESNTIKSQNGTSLSLYNNSNNGLTVATDGNVGVGTTNPSEQLEVEGIGKFNVNAGTALIANGGVSQPVNINYQQNSIYKAFTGIDQDGNYQVGTTGNIEFFPNSGTDGNTIINNGNVGIGTTNPTIDLAIGDNSTGLNQEGVGKLSIYANNIKRFTVNTTGVAIGLPDPVEKLTLDGSITTLADQFLGFNLYYDNGWKAYQIGPVAVLNHETVNNANRFEIKTGVLTSYNQDDPVTFNPSTVFKDGNVGIGTTSPVGRLEVDGDMIFSNHNTFIGMNVYYDTDWRYRTSGQYGGVLKFTTDGNWYMSVAGLGTAGQVLNNERFTFNVFNNNTLRFGSNANPPSLNGIAITNIYQTGQLTTSPSGGENIKTSGSCSAISISYLDNLNTRYTWDIGSNIDNDLSFYQRNVLKGFITDGNNNGQMNFTGQHRCLMNNNISLEDYKGLIVIPSNKYINIDNSLIPTINESLPYCQLCNNENNKSVFGVISDEEDLNGARKYENGNFVSCHRKTNSNEQRIFINSLGEGALWVCNKNGILTNGDYISSSSVPGYGMKQTLNEGILSNHTVAKMTCDCDFSLTKIVKKKLNTIEVITVENRDKKVSVEKTREETKIEYDENTGRYVQKTITETYTEEEIVYDEVDVYDEEGNIIGKHKVAQKEDYNITTQKIVFDSQGDPEFVDDLDEEGNIQMVYPYETRFLKADGTLLTDQADYEARLANGESVYIACFVGCTYHCG
jgi:hypothetical protein